TRRRQREGRPATHLQGARGVGVGLLARAAARAVACVPADVAVRHCALVVQIGLSRRDVGARPGVARNVARLAGAARLRRAADAVDAAESAETSLGGAALTLPRVVPTHVRL